MHPVQPVPPGHGDGVGEGRPNSSLALVSEQPGDREDQPGHPFVGPAGRLLDQALRESGIDRAAPGRLEEVGVGEWRGPVLSTVHPSSILRTPDSGAREKALAGFVADLVKAREAPAA